MITDYKSGNIHILSSKKIDKKLWDTFIDRAFNSNVYFTSWYLDIVTKGKWLAILDNTYSWLLPIPINKDKELKKNINYYRILPYTTLIFQNPNHLDINWQEITTKYKKIKRILSKTKTEIKYFPDKKLLKKSSRINYELDLPYGLDLIRNHPAYQTFEHYTNKAGLYANTQIPIKGILLFIFENLPSNSAKFLKKIITTAETHGRLTSIGIYNNQSRLVALSIALLLRNRLNLITSITASNAQEQPEYYRFLTLQKICQSFYNINLTLEIPEQLDFFHKLPFAEIMKKIPLYHFDIKH